VAKTCSRISPSTLLHMTAMPTIPAERAMVALLPDDFFTMYGLLKT